MKMNFVKSLVAGVICFCASSCSTEPDAYVFASRVSEGEILGEWHLARVMPYAEKTFAEYGIRLDENTAIHLLEDRRAVLKNVPFVIGRDFSDTYQLANGNGFWELLERKNLDGHSYWVVLLTSAQLKAAIPLSVRSASEGIILDYVVDPEYDSGVQFKRLDR